MYARVPYLALFSISDLMMNANAIYSVLVAELVSSSQKTEQPLLE
jgi:hypothetical protein